MSISRDEGDPVATVVDWLDACRNRRICALLELYDEAATLECACDGQQSLSGRAALEAYWRPRLAAASSPESFAMDDVAADAEGVMLDYRNHDGKPVRIHFRFSQTGKILHTRCRSLGRCAA
jgi:ketosteroid isomerase-like protein